MDVILFYSEGPEMLHRPNIKFEVSSMTNLCDISFEIFPSSFSHQCDILKQRLYCVSCLHTNVSPSLMRQCDFGKGPCNCTLSTWAPRMHCSSAGNVNQTELLRIYCGQTVGVSPCSYNIYRLFKMLSCFVKYWRLTLLLMKCLLMLCDTRDGLVIF